MKLYLIRSICLHLLLVYCITGAVEEKKKKNNADIQIKDITNANNDQVQEDTIPIINGDVVDVIKMIPAPDLTKEDPEHRSKTIDSQTKDDNEDIKIDLGVEQTNEEIMNLLEKTLKLKYSTVLSTLINEPDENEDKLVLNQQPIAVQEPILTPAEAEAEKYFKEGMEMLTDISSKRKDGLMLLEKASEMDHKSAKAMIGWEKLFGTLLPLNISEAKEIFDELVQYGTPEAHMGLGFLYATGIGVNASQPRALVHYMFAAIGKNLWAQMAIAYRYWNGVTVTSDCETALTYYRTVANKVASQVSFSGGPVVQRIRLLDETDNPSYSTSIMDKDLLDYYQMLADKGDVQSQVGLGQLHYQGGRGVELDSQKAHHYFLSAADSGNSVAVAFLGKMYLEGNEYVKQDNDTAFKYFKKAADSGNAVGQSGLGLMYLQGRGVEKDYDKAFKLFTQAAEQGWVDGQLHLGLMHFEGLGTKQDFKAANKYFIMASQSGHVLAFYYLAQMHATGIGVMRSCTGASELYKHVAERGKWSNKMMEAHSEYRDGNVNQAYIKYALLAEMGYEVAQSNVAFILDRGEVTLWNTPRDIQTRALMYWNRAAGQGNSAAQVKVGDYHYYGLGTKIDYETAAMHYRVASDQQSNAQAMFNLGYMHEQGLGMAQDMYLAKRCYDLAAETSSDARLPVALALMKLSAYFTFKSLKEKTLYDWIMLPDLDDIFGPNWDLFLLAVLIVALICIVFLRRAPR